MIIAQSFMKQLKRLPQKEQGVVSRTVLELQADPTAATLSLHKVDGEAGWWSAYANGDLRIILARPGEGELVLCWTDHHDKAYLWAKRHVLAQHPVTQAMQLVEIPEVEAARAGREPYQSARTVGADSAVGADVLGRPPCSRLNITRDDLLAWGVPELWVDRVLAARDEDELLDIGEHHLPSDAAEVVLKIAVGERPATEEPESGRPRTPAPTGAHGVGTPPNGGFDPQSWWVVSEDDDLTAALENLDWDAWCVYLHPSQRKIAYRLYSGPYRVCGSAGTGKTVVALHHAKFILEQDAAAQVLVLTYSGDLAKDLRRRCVPLMTPRVLERCAVTTIAQFARKQFDALFPGHGALIPRKELRIEALRILQFNRELLPKGITPQFALSEFERVVEPRQITSETDYQKTLRRGVHIRLSSERRAALWRAMAKVYEGINGDEGYVTTEQMFAKLADYYRAHPETPRLYTDIIVDECQDLCEVELDFLMAYLSGTGRVFFAGDIGQRIIRFSFPWKPHGVDFRGRSRVLKVNYRTTHEIRSVADRLTTPEATDADEIVQNRRGTVSLLSGPRPEFRRFPDPEAEKDGVADWLDHLYHDLNLRGNSVAIFYRSDHELGRAQEVLERSAYAGEPVKPHVVQMFQAKGLEYRAAVVMACDNDVIPSPTRLAEADLVAGLEEIYDTERNLLYVACTRARDYLLVTCGGTPSELLLDMEKAR